MTLELSHFGWPRRRHIISASQRKLMRTAPIRHMPLWIMTSLTLALAPHPVTPQILPTDRTTVWSPGITGGVPVRTTICATVNASTYGNGASDASAGIQAAVDAC